MKNHLLNFRVLNAKIVVVILAGLLFSIFNPGDSTAQNGGTVVMGQAFVYNNVENDQDTTGLVGENVYVKFYRLNNSNQLIFVAQAPVNSDGYYKATVYTSQDLYAIYIGDDVDNNFVTTFYPGWLDFESAEVIEVAGHDTVDFDWGAVGKEIVERPSSGALISNVRGRVNTETPSFSEDFVPTVSVFDLDGNLIANAPILKDGSYEVSFFGNGNYEVFTSIPGFVSQSKNITASTTTKVDHNVNFNLDTYRGESELTPSTTIVADKFSLNQNYPNPFNPTTNINFTVGTTGIVKLTVYNSQGKEVTKLVNDLVEAGSYDITFNGANLASGVYYYTLQIGNNIVTKKMNLIK